MQKSQNNGNMDERLFCIDEERAYFIVIHRYFSFHLQPIYFKCMVDGEGGGGCKNSTSFVMLAFFHYAIDVKLDQFENINNKEETTVMYKKAEILRQSSNFTQKNVNSLKQSALLMYLHSSCWDRNLRVAISA